MDRLTREFFSCSFPGYNQPVWLDSDPLKVNVPVLELPLDVDTNFLLRTLVTETAKPIKRKQYPYENEPRLANWDLEILWSDGATSTYLEDIYYKKPGPVAAHKQATGAGQVVQQYLQSRGISVKLCMLSVFHPNGYVRPHRDINLNSRPLNYFWLPLNNPHGAELKIYPWGSVAVNLGSVYLLNHENYVHSVKNQSDQKRYAVLGYIDTVTDTVSQLIKQSLEKNYSCKH